MINKLPHHPSSGCLKFRNMKKSIIIILLSALIPFAACARSSAVATESSSYGTASIKKQGSAEAIIRDFSSTDGFNILSIKGFGTGIIKKMIISAMDRNDPEQRAFADMISGIKKLTVVEYSDCDDSTKERFLKKIQLGIVNLDDAGTFGPRTVQHVHRRVEPPVVPADVARMIRCVDMLEKMSVPIELEDARAIDAQINGIRRTGEPLDMNSFPERRERTRFRFKACRQPIRPEGRLTSGDGQRDCHNEANRPSHPNHRPSSP